MLQHPLTLFLSVADLLLGGMVLASGRGAWGTVVGWRPASASAEQLLRERRWDVSAWLLMWCWWLALLLFGLHFLALAVVLPTAVTGAMCGAGVCEVMGGAGESALGLRGAAFLALSGARLAVRLDLAHPESKVAPQAGAMVLIALVLVWWSALSTVRGWLVLDGMAVASCCAALLAAQRESVGGVGVASLWLFWTTGTLSVVIGLVMLRRREARSWPLAFFAVALAWLVGARWASEDFFTLWHHGALQHRCLWCMVSELGAWPGWLMFVAWFGALLELGAAVLAVGWSRRGEELGQVVADGAWARVVLAVRRWSFWVVLFGLLAYWPLVFGQEGL